MLKNIFYSRLYTNQLTFKHHFVFLCHLLILFFNKENNSPGKTFAWKHASKFFRGRTTEESDLFLTYIFSLAYKHVRWKSRQISQRSLWHFKWFMQTFCVCCLFWLMRKHANLIRGTNLLHLANDLVLSSEWFSWYVISSNIIENMS